MEGSFSSLYWDGLAVTTDGFRARGDGRFRTLDLEGIRTEVGLGGISRGFWELKGSTIRRMNVDIDTTAKPPPETPAAHTTTPVTRRKGWLPSRVEPDSLAVENCTLTVALERGRLRLDGAKLHVRNEASHSIDFMVHGGSITVPLAFKNLPAFKLDSARGRWQDKQFSLVEASTTIGGDGRLSLSGEWDGHTRTSNFDGAVENIRCEDFLDSTWAKRVSGSLSGPFSVRVSEGLCSANGSAVLRQGTLTALPFLDTLAAYADTHRLRTLHLTEARTEWRWRKDQLDLTSLTLASENLIRLEGSLSIREQKLDGRFRLGIAPGTLAHVPGAESMVFLPGERGLLWTSLQLSGTLKKPKEDLSARLVQAAGQRMFEVLPETGQTILRLPGTVLGPNAEERINNGINNAVSTGSEIIQEFSNFIPGQLLPPPLPEKDDEIER